jgi:hypothetical protein
MNSAKFPPASLAWTVWGLGALLYLIGFYQRVAPAVITDQLMLEFASAARRWATSRPSISIPTWRCRFPPA